MSLSLVFRSMATLLPLKITAQDINNGSKYIFQEAQSFYPTETENLIVTSDDTLAAR